MVQTFSSVVQDMGAATAQLYQNATKVGGALVSGVQAGSSGDFRAVIGVDRGAGHQTLLDAGATFVVDDLSELLPTP